ncbi:ATP:guanido phosphotransferase [Isosphaera pallida ATCC 43644]|jgi:protein arginine kinase|uniref:Protein-arginine kinase n=1 Tax=Isosphaera pallida (strain ATCC 43644 / DSM 9630 / IS1B) TaxID=575540 RepID=E8QWY6_ISOPI|nr:protein arginine kinase [Isosphaera pallida]ADV64025.1 ATP:guanido phosphotransferase [Isosphaera pallida ATCC 43644]
MNLNDLLRSTGEWLRGEGPSCDIVVCSRVRLARNLADFPFASRASRGDKLEIESIARRTFEELDLGLTFFDVDELNQIDRQFLVERQLISREQANGEGPRGVAIFPRETISIMVNEEDHLRIQEMRSGFRLSELWEDINELDDRIESKITYAFSPKLGYLTACPTNVGTGIRVGVMVHLPALVYVKQIDKVFRGLQKVHLAVRGLYGEGTQAFGDFYQISNQRTLGHSERELVDKLEEIIPQVLDHERKARQTLLRDRRQEIKDRVARALGALTSAHVISSDETMHLLSIVRMGISLELVNDLTIPQLNELFLHTQPAHLQKLQGAVMDSDDRNLARALYLKRKLAEVRG